ncbi:MAG: tetratricopeptide repeat protein [Promethearchaeota archaeon]
MSSPRELFQRAYKASNDRQFEQAKQIYLQVIKLDPNYSMAWNNLGWIYYDQYQNYSEAESCYKTALKCDKNNYYAWNNYGIWYYRHKKKYKAAERCWQKAVKLYPDFGLAWNNLGVLYKFQIRKPEKAQQCNDKLEAITQKNILSARDKKSQQIKACVDCGAELSETQNICERCGTTND